MKRTKNTTRPERETKADDIMSKDRVHNVKSTVVVPREVRH